MLVAILVLKAVTNAAAVGPGLPAGLIGPTLVIGAGGAMGIVGQHLQPDVSSSAAFYVMLGMAGMMATVLRAPLAALMTVLEMTMNPNLILPAMLIITVATLVVGELFKRKSAFLATIHSLGMQPPLQARGAEPAAGRGHGSFQRLPAVAAQAQARRALGGNPAWIVVEGAQGDLRCALKPADLPIALQQERGDGPGLDLLELPGMRLDLAGVDARATVEEAQRLLGALPVEALAVRNQSAAKGATLVGIVTQNEIDSYRRTPPARQQGEDS